MRSIEDFIIKAGKVTFTDTTGQRWRIRQPLPEEAAQGDSAYRLAYRAVTQDARLKDLARSDDELKREAATRGAAAEAMYMLPLLLEREGDDGWQAAYDPFDADSLAEFEQLTGAVISQMTRLYLGPVQEAIREAKKKSLISSLSSSPPAAASGDGLSSNLQSAGPTPKSSTSKKQTAA